VLETLEVNDAVLVSRQVGNDVLEETGHGRVSSWVHWAECNQQAIVWDERVCAWSSDVILGRPHKTHGLTGLVVSHWISCCVCSSDIAGSWHFAWIVLVGNVIISSVLSEDAPHEVAPSSRIALAFGVVVSLSVRVGILGACYPRVSSDSHRAPQHYYCCSNSRIRVSHSGRC